MQFLNFPFSSSSSYLMFGNVPDRLCLPGSILRIHDEVRNLDIMIEQNLIEIFVPLQDQEKEIRKQVDEAIAQAKVRSMTAVVVLKLFCSSCSCL